MANRVTTARREVIQLEDSWYVLATSSRGSDRTRVLKHDDSFGVYDRYGDIYSYGAGEHGLYHEGTRYLSRLEMTINGHRPLVLNSTVKTDNTLLLVDVTTPDIVDAAGRITILKDTLHVFRARLLRNGVQYEHLRLVNYGDTDIDVVVDIDLDADYADIFEVRGVTRAQRGKLRPMQRQGNELSIDYEGLDGIVRRTRIQFDASWAAHTDGRLEFAQRLAPREPRDLFLAVACETGDERREILSYEKALAQADIELASRRQDISEISSSNSEFNDWLNRSSADVCMLITRTPHGLYPYAGVPWFSTPFGRDGIITAMQFLWVYPTLARGVLTFLAAHQATEDNAEQDAEPGKILHETRKGEMAALSEVPFGRYYGSVDSTPLFVMLAGAYYDRTGDREFVEKLWPNIDAALSWIDRYGDVDGDGFIEYRRRCGRGLLHQGWKDSSDSVFHADGRPALGPIALCEVQGYVYGAKTAGAQLARVLGDAARAATLERAAIELRNRFDDAFWCPQIQSYAIALDGQKRQCCVRSSNAGHALFTGIADTNRARTLADTLMSDSSFNGWGLRTIAAGESRFNPMSYHNGSIWPHDNAMIAAGLARYGFPDRALRILSGQFEASVAMELDRLPELFCGFPRIGGHVPTLYPVACSPQAWAAGAAFMLLQSCLGLTFSSEKPQLRFHHPVLPAYLDWLQIRDLRIGESMLDLRLMRYAVDVGIDVTRRQGDVEIAVFL